MPLWQVIQIDRSTTAGRRRSFQRCKSVTPEEEDVHIDIEIDNPNNEDAIRVVQVHQHEKGE